MPKRLPENLLERTLEEIRGSSASLSIDELFHRLKGAVSRRSLQRRLAGWAAEGVVQIEGQGRGRRYSVIRPVQPRALAVAADNTSIPISSEAQGVRDAVTRSIIDRTPVGYQRELLDRYKPNETFYSVGEDAKETQMILNHKAAIELLVDS